MNNYKIIILLSTLFIFFIIENLLPYYKNRFFKKRLIYNLQNIILALLNGVVVFLGFSVLFLKLFELIGNNLIGLLNIISMPYIINVFLGFLLFDLWIYFWHFLNHKSKFLWKFHRAHHSDIDMDSTTAIRFHTGEILISTILKIPVLIILGINPEIVIIHEIVLNVSTIFHHSNIALPESIDKILRVIIVTPNMHRIHHSQIMKETDSNYSTIFSFWDRLFRTFVMIKEIPGIKLGLKEYVDKKWQNLWGIIITPFVKAQ